MARNAKNGRAVVSVAGERGDTRGAMMAATRHRVVAILGQAFDLIEDDDPAAALAERYKADPLGYLERVAKLLGEPGSPAAGLTNNFNSLFVLAAKQVAERDAPQPVTIDGEARVLPGYSDPEPIDEWE